jgi:micrococcal nuclease
VPVEITVAPDALPAGEDVVVARVVDGDTVVVAEDRKVRLIGVDTPETRHPDLGVQCYGREASAFLTGLLPPGTDVRLVRDVDPFDRYDRELAYVYRLDDGAFVNAELVRQGYAQIATVPPNVRHVDELFELQREAREANRGLWSACPGVGDPAPGVVAPDDDPSTCDPSYPDVCVPPPPPDLDCDDVDAQAFAVRPPDPHHLDGDGDGTACAG